MVEALFVIDVKAWGLFIMKGAAALIFAPCLGDFYRLANQCGQRRARAQFIQKGRGQGHFRSLAQSPAHANCRVAGSGFPRVRNRGHITQTRILVRHQNGGDAWHGGDFCGIARRCHHPIVIGEDMLNLSAALQQYFGNAGRKTIALSDFAEQSGQIAQRRFVGRSEIISFSVKKANTPDSHGAISSIVLTCIWMTTVVYQTLIDIHLRDP
jgi:hypothetical protein